MNENVQKKKTYLALGDSYTIGEGVASSDSWPMLLTKALNQDGLNFDSPKIIAQTGWRTDHLIAAIREENLSEKYDLVSVLIGVNNQFQHGSLEQFEIELREIIKTAISQCKSGSNGLFVLSIPDYGSTPFGKADRQEIGKEIDTWNKACKSICIQENILFIDITEISKRASSEASLTTTDHLHPSKKMYLLWVEAIRLKVKAMFTVD